MALQSSGAISLNDIHIEAGGSSGTNASLNDSDIRALIGKSSGAQSSFNEFYGASSDPEFIGAQTRTATSNFGAFSFSIGLMSPSVQVGDLVVFNCTSQYPMTNTPTCSGMTITNLGQYSGFPGNFVAYGFRQSGDSNYISFSGSPTGYAICAVMAVFRNVTTLKNSNYQFRSTGMPNPATLSGVSGTKMFVLTGHLDDDAVTMTAPSGYTMAGAQYFQSGIYRSSAGIAYKFSTNNANENAGAFGGGGNDSNAAYLMRFG